MGRNDGDGADWPSLVKIPADVDKDDAVLGPLSARQTVQLAAVALVLWIGYQAAKRLVPPVFYLAVALPVAALAALAVLTRRDHLPLDRWLLAAWHHHRSPRRLVPGTSSAESMPWQKDLQRNSPLVEVSELAFPVVDVGLDGVLGMGPAGHVSMSRAGTVNFGLRTGGEQQVLVAGFARWLNALTGPVQILVRTQRFEIGPAIAGLEQSAPALPHPLLEEACREHASFLADLAVEQDLLTRQVLLAHRETSTDRAAGTRALRRADEATSLLAAAEIPVHVLSASEVFAQLAAATAPDTPLHPNPALPQVPVTRSEHGAAW